MDVDMDELDELSGSSAFEDVDDPEEPLLNLEQEYILDPLEGEQFVNFY
jgi:hypothetical protein